MKLYLTGLGFLTVFSFIIGVYLMLTAKKRAILARLETVTRTTATGSGEGEVRRRERFKLKDILTIMGRAFAARGFTKKMEGELLKADYPVRGEEFIVFNLITTITGALVGYTLAGIGASIIFGALGMLVPTLVVQQKKKKRFEKLNEQIGDCLTVMSNSLRAGYSFQQAIELVAREMTGPLAMEFKKTLREIALGTHTEQALLNLVNRVESDDLELMVTAVLIQRQVGGNLAEVLDNISHTLRERIRIKGEIKTLTAQGRISGLIIGLMPPLLFAVLMVLNPGYISILIKTQIGIVLLVAGAISELIGVMVIRKIVDIEL